ncbi:hypothetical protein BOSP111201_10310 [Bordetella sputigena]|uniref:hypothetical protein n=1 Tax=Bordetella sputigena TaxID=1416810 RepID=UPI0039F124E7
MHRNNDVYKGYRLTAKVARDVPEPADGGTPVFRAVVCVAPASLQPSDGDEYPIPRFVDGGFVYSPAEAVHAAVAHGREIVDALSGVRLAVS